MYDCTNIGFLVVILIFQVLVVLRMYFMCSALGSALCLVVCLSALCLLLVAVW
jgi:hypothetical protein